MFWCCGWRCPAILFCARFPSQILDGTEGTFPLLGQMRRDKTMNFLQDERKYNRCLELLEMNEELKRARKVSFAVGFEKAETWVHSFAFPILPPHCYHVFPYTCLFFTQSFECNALNLVSLIVSSAYNWTLSYTYTNQSRLIERWQNSMRCGDVARKQNFDFDESQAKEENA